MYIRVVLVLNLFLCCFAQRQFSRNDDFEVNLLDSTGVNNNAPPTVFSFLETILVPARWFGISPPIVTSKDWEEFRRFLDGVAAVRNSQLGIYEIKDFKQKKRNVENDEATTLKCGIGKNFNGSKTMDKCYGRNCTINQFVCGNTVYTYGQDVGNITGIENCTIISITCFGTSLNSDSPDSNSSGISKVEIVKFSRPDCVAQKFECNGLEVPPSEITGNIFSCSVQVLCGNTVYGWDAFDYLCVSDALKCNGTIIEDPNYMLVSNSCVVEKIGCKTYGHDSEEKCHTITQKCTSSLSDALCTGEHNDHRIECDPVVGSYRCVPKIVQCLGQSLNYSDLNESLATCEEIQSVTCGDKEFPLPTNNSICRIIELSCRGQIITYTNQPNIPPECTISKVWCLGVPNVLDCTSFSFGCTSQGGCRYNDTLILCRSECFQPGTVEQCLCPVDYEGEHCETPRRIECNMTLVSPQKFCPEYSKKYFAPEICLRFDKTSKARLEYKIECTFRGDTKFNRDTVSKDGFKYGIVTDKIALTEPPQKWYIRTKFQNFDFFSDNSQVFTQQLDAQYFLGQKNFAVDIDFSKIPQNFMPGGVLYIEYKLLSNGTHRPHYGVIGRELISVTGVSQLRKKFDLDVPFLIAAVFTSLAVLALWAIFIYCVCFKKAKKNDKQKYL